MFNKIAIMKNNLFILVNKINLISQKLNFKLYYCGKPFNSTQNQIFPWHYLIYIILYTRNLAFTLHWSFPKF